MSSLRSILFQKSRAFNTRVHKIFMAQVFQVLEGFAKEQNKSYFADGSVSLVVDRDVRLLVDTGGPHTQNTLIEKLSSLLQKGCEDITHVVCTHGHSDHIGNLNLFQNAVVYLGNDVLFPGKRYESHDFDEKSLVINENIEILSTPGHTDHDISVLVKTFDKGIVCIAGDLFENENDSRNPEMWRQNSKYPEKQEISRQKIYRLADYIIPGHGKMFKIFKNEKT